MVLLQWLVNGANSQLAMGNWWQGKNENWHADCEYKVITKTIASSVDSCSWWTKHTTNFYWWHSVTSVASVTGNWSAAVDF